jgi:hypothetical protein
LRLYRAQVATFLDQHAAAPQVMAAVALLDDYLRRRGFGTYGSPLYDHINRLALDGLTGRELLEVVGSVFLFAYYFPKSLPDDRRLTYTLGYSVITAKPLPVRHYGDRTGKLKASKVSGEPRRVVGEFIRSALGVFFLRVTEKFEADYRRTVATNLTLAEPFA